MNADFLINYQPGKRFLQRLNGKTKVLLFTASLMVMMQSFDLRFLAPVFIIHLFLLISVKPKWKQLKGVITFIVLMNLLNIFLFYLAKPDIGLTYTGSSTILYRFNGYFIITYETLIYFLTRMTKIFGVVLISLWFMVSITPSQLASGLSGCGLPYHFSTMVALGFRYIPDIFNDYKTIQESTQMRGVEMDARRTSLMMRLKQTVLVLFPLIMVSFDRVGTIASAMELRGFGQKRRRTYYCELPPTREDYLMRGFAFIELAVFVFYLILSLNGWVPKLWLP